MATATAAAAAARPPKGEWVDLLDLHDWLTTKHLRVTSTRIIGEFGGQLWIEAKTTSVTATEGDNVADETSEGGSRQRQERRGQP